MDISKIDYIFIEHFHMCYSSACEVYGENFENNSDKKQKKIRKWIEKTYFDGVAFPKKVEKLIAKDISNADFFVLLKSCYIYVENEGTKQKQLFEKSAENISPDAKSALWEFIENGSSATVFKMHGNDAYINSVESSAYCCTLILKNASGIPTNCDWLYFDGLNNFIKDDEGYRLLGMASNWDDETEIPFVIRFTDVQVEVKSYNAVDDIHINHANDPWTNLIWVANGILYKSDYLYNYELNEKEKALEPLMRDLKKIFWVSPPKNEEIADFSVFREYVKKYGDNKLLEKLNNYEKVFTNGRKKYNYSLKLIATLNQQKYEPLWRVIYNEIAESQAMYPKFTDELCDKTDLKEKRAEIQRLMEAHGYSGTYPDFIKRGEMKKLHLTDSYEMTYFVGREKNVEYHIHCEEYYFNEILTIEFLCGTALLRNGENVEDIHSCTFNAKGRRIAHKVTYESTTIDDYGDVVPQKIEPIVQIAVKKAELLKLTKEERELYTNIDMPAWTLLLGFLFMGLLFAVFMTLGMMLFCSLVTVILLGPKEIPEMLSEMPWWQMFVFAFVGFGGAMTILEIIAKRK